MQIAADRWAAALTPGQYLESMNDNRALFEANLAAATFSADELAAFAALPAPVDVLAFTEDWCGDSAANLPMVVKLANDTQRLTLRILRREGNEDITNHYLFEDGRNHIPTYLFLDAEGNVTGHFIERPAAITERLNAFRAAWSAAHPEIDPARTLFEQDPPVRERFVVDMKAFRATLRDQEARAIAAAFAALAGAAAPQPVA